MPVQPGWMACSGTIAGLEQTEVTLGYFPFVSCWAPNLTNGATWICTSYLAEANPRSPCRAPRPNIGGFRHCMCCHCWSHLLLSPFCPCSSFPLPRNTPPGLQNSLQPPSPIPSNIRLTHICAGWYGQHVVTPLLLQYILCTMTSPLPPEY